MVVLRDYFGFRLHTQFWPVLSWFEHYFLSLYVSETLVYVSVSIFVFVLFRDITYLSRSDCAYHNCVLNPMVTKPCGKSLKTKFRYDSKRGRWRVQRDRAYMVGRGLWWAYYVQVIKIQGWEGHREHATRTKYIICRITAAAWEIRLFMDRIDIQF